MGGWIQLVQVFDLSNRIAEIVIFTRAEDRVYIYIYVYILKRPIRDQESGIWISIGIGIGILLSTDNGQTGN